MAVIDDQAVCVRTWDWSETSQTAVLMTRNHGMVRVLAKGSKRERSAFSGGLEICTSASMSAIIRPSSELALLTVWDLLDPMLSIRKNLKSYSAAVMAVDLVPRLVQDHDPHPGIFDALLSLLRLTNSLDYPDQSTLVAGLAWYQWVLLVEIGAMPVFDCDVLSGDALEPADVYGFSSELGGITQDPITNEGQTFSDASTDRVGVWRVRSQTVDFFRSVGPRPDIDQFIQEPADRMLRSARLLSSFIQERTGSEIPSMRWLLRE